MEKKIIHFETLGCRLNQDETEGAARVFSLNGFTTDLEAASAATPQDENVILCIINTCTVTSKAEQKARRIMRLLLKTYPKSLLIVTGCYAELDREEISAICPERISILPGTSKYVLSQIATEMNGGSLCNLTHENLDEFISRKLNSMENMNASSERSKRLVLNPQKKELSLNNFALYTPVFEKHTRPSIKIQDGCNNACTFCRIHLARGSSISLDVESVLSRVKELEKNDATEVVFTGVNLSQYLGECSDGSKLNFAGLLALLLKETSKIKFRISSFYPQHVNEELCAVLKDERVQPFFHLSVQSGSDEILKRMARPYKAETVLKAVELLRNTKSDTFISCDIIAGFPGETEADFEQTKLLCQKAKFSWIHAFPFSPRKGTPAFSMKNQIPERIKDERVKWLTENAIQNKIDYISSFAKKRLEAVVENSRSQRLAKENDSEKKLLHAVTDNFIHVEFVSEGSIAPGQKIFVKILNAKPEAIREGREVEAAAEFDGLA